MFLYFKIDGNYIYVEKRFINHKKETNWFEIFVKKFTILMFVYNLKLHITPVNPKIV